MNTTKTEAEQIAELKLALKNADELSGRLLRENEYLQDSASRRESWLREAKRAAGYSVTVSFDQVWAEALAALLEKGKTPEERAKPQGLKGL